MARRFDVPGLRALGLSPSDFAPLILSTTVTLTDAQIRALPSTPVVVIPASETLGFSGFPTSLPRIVYATAILDATGGAYHNVSNGNLNLCYASDASGAQAATTMRSSSNNPYIATSGISQDPIKQLFSFFVLDSLPIESASLLDNAISITMTNDDGVLSDGAAGNTLKITAYYIVVAT